MFYGKIIPMDIISSIFSIIILIISVMFHELAHGTVADKLGDPTPGLAGRLTLNPIKHLEFVGSFLLPLLCIISGSGFIIGWAKPVPFNPNYLKNKRWGPAMVAAAGPIMNIVIALISAAAFRLVAPHANFVFVAQLLVMVVMINISLAIFNLIPVPPLDGHHILGSLFPRYKLWSDRVMRGYGMILLVIVILALGSFIAPAVGFVSRILLGA